MNIYNFWKAFLFHTTYCYFASCIFSVSWCRLFFTFLIMQYRWPRSRQAIDPLYTTDQSKNTMWTVNESNMSSEPIRAAIRGLEGESPPCFARTVVPSQELVPFWPGYKPRKTGDSEVETYQLVTQDRPWKNRKRGSDYLANKRTPAIIIPRLVVRSQVE